MGGFPLALPGLRGCQDDYKLLLILTAQDSDYSLLHVKIATKSSHKSVLPSQRESCIDREVSASACLPASC